MYPYIYMESPIYNENIQLSYTQLAQYLSWLTDSPRPSTLHKKATIHQITTMQATFS